MNRSSEELRLILEKALSAPKRLSRAEIARLVAVSSPEETAAVRRAAYALKRRHCGDFVSLRGLVEVGNRCGKDCYYCGIRRSNSALRRYHLSVGEVETLAAAAAELQLGSLVLQGGELATAAEDDFITECLERIAPFGLGVTLSFGERDEAVYRRWKAAGAARYLLRIETSSPRLYAALHPADHSFERRKECLDALRRTGYQVGTGVMCALPGQTADDLAGDILFFAEKDADMIGMGPYIPHPDTPLRATAPSVPAAERLNLALNMISATRLYLHDVNIAATTALEALAPDGREQGVLAGANVMMPNLTFPERRREYSLYAGKPDEAGTAAARLAALEKSLSAIGERINFGRRGDSVHFALRTGGAA